MNRTQGRILLATCVAFAFGACSGTPDQPESAPMHIGSVVRLDERLDALIDLGVRPEILADGFDWAEGPVWVEDGGYLLFSDIPSNKVHRWRAGDGLSVFLYPSGYTGEAPRSGEVGSNGLTLDSDGRLVLAQHGDRRIARLAAELSDPTPTYETIASLYEGKRFNSPNDLVFHSGGALYFTDPPYGLERNMDDPAKELDFQGVFRLDVDSSVTLLTDELSRPNGIAFSPDEKTLYVANSDPEHAVWMAWDVLDDGSIANGRTFFDATGLVEQGELGLPDGLKVDAAGNLFATGPGGVLVFASDGTHLGTVKTTQATSNCAFGDGNAALYITADMYLLRIALRR